MSEKLNIVLGNEFVTHKGVHYVAKSGCGDEAELDESGLQVGAQCDPAPARVAKSPDEIVYINRQNSAVELGMKAAEDEVRKRLLARFSQSREVTVIATDQFAVPDLAKGRSLHRQFNNRFRKGTGKDIDNCGSLVEDVRKALAQILEEVSLFIQLDHSDNVKNYLTEAAYDGFLSRYGISSHTEFKESLISEEFLSEGIRLSHVHPNVSKPFEEALSHVSFSLFNVRVLFERVIRDHLARMAMSCGWDDAVNTREDGTPFYNSEPGESVRNAVNFGGRGDKPIIACLGVVGGVPTLISHQSSGHVQLFMEEDRLKKRVDRKVILGGLEFYHQVVAEEDDIPASNGYPLMGMPEPVSTELIMTSTSAESVFPISK